MVLELFDDNLQNLLASQRPDIKAYEDIYRQIHASPELSGQEEETAKLAADHLRQFGFRVHTRIGGYGVAGVLRNGSGPTVLLRADMDALPLEEQTGLPYASKKVIKDQDGYLRPVMHACGHDTHVVALMASAAFLHSLKDHWSGTVICIFQPAEEQLCGARAMLEDGLYEKIPKPQVVLAQHIMPIKSGTVSVEPGRMLTSADAIDVRIFGRVVIGVAVVNRLQSIVSREVTPGELAVVSCGSIQAGSTANIIPDTLDLKLSVRTYSKETRDSVLRAIRRIVMSECEASGAVKKPLINITQSAPATISDEATVETLKKAFVSVFKDNMVPMTPTTASEDFSLLASSIGVPYVMWAFWGVDPNIWDDAISKRTINMLPNNHSSFFAPTISPTLQTGVDAMTVGALAFLGKKSDER